MVGLTSIRWAGEWDGTSHLSKCPSDQRQKCTPKKGNHFLAIHFKRAACKTAQRKLLLFMCRILFEVIVQDVRMVDTRHRVESIISKVFYVDVMLKLPIAFFLF